MAEGEDLYDDLYEDVGDMLLPKAPFQAFHEMRKLIDLAMLSQNDTREKEFKKKEAELNNKVELLQKEVEALKQEKAVLTRNISCLFKTAQMELARKDKQMKELRDENLHFKLGGTRGPVNVMPLLNKAVPVDKNNEQGLMTRENNHQNSSAVEIHDARIFDEPPRSQNRQLHHQSHTVLSTDRVARGSSSTQLPLRGHASQCHAVSPKLTPEIIILDVAYEQAVGMDRSQQSNRGPVSFESTARIHEPDSDRRRQSSTEGKKPRSLSRGILNSCQQRDVSPDGSRHTADDSINKRRNSDNHEDSRSDRPRDGRFDSNMRHADNGYTKYRSPERIRDSGHDRSRNRRVDGSLRNSDNRKRHRSLSREKDVRPEDQENSRGAKAINRSGSESSRERQKDHSNRYHR